MWYQLPANIKFSMKTITVELSDKTLEVKQLPLRRYSELLKAVQGLPAKFGGIEKMSNDQIFEQLPTLLATSLPDLIGLLTIATELKAEEIEEMGLSDAIKVVVAVIEVNDYRGVFEQIKKVTARPMANQTLPTPAK